jgi:hypothetical protein
MAALLCQLTGSIPDRTVRHRPKGFGVAPVRPGARRRSLSAFIGWHFVTADTTGTIRTFDARSPPYAPFLMSSLERGAYS